MSKIEKFIRIDKMGLLNAFAVVFGFYCIVASLVTIAVCRVHVGPVTIYNHLMDFIWSMAFGAIALGLLFWRLKRFNSFAKKFAIALIVLAILVQIINIIGIIYEVYYALHPQPLTW
jgi:hypothetical protein